MPADGAARRRRIVERLSPAANRTRSEWVTDAVLFACALFVWSLTLNPQVQPQVPPQLRGWDLVLGAIAVGSIWWSRRYPLAVGIGMIPIGAFSTSAMIAVIVTVYRLGLLAPIRPALVVTLLHIATAIPYFAVWPPPGMTWASWLVLIPLLYTLSLCVGLLGRTRRQLIVGLRESAARDRERYQEHLATLRRDERERIAREMHDVLAHRISLLSMHAGALEFRTTSPSPPRADELNRAARVIRENAQAAVEDLRELLGLLRSDGELGTGAPQPRLADLPALVQDAVAAGQRIDYASDANPRRLRETTQRTAYRVVQEALTNARKHAPGAAVTVRLEQDGSRLAITVVNPVPPGFTRWDLPPPGNGLVGLEERIRIEDGRFSATVEEGRFRLRAELPLGAA